MSLDHAPFLYNISNGIGHLALSQSVTLAGCIVVHRHYQRAVSWLLDLNATFGLQRAFRLLDIVDDASVSLGSLLISVVNQYLIQSVLFVLQTHLAPGLVLSSPQSLSHSVPLRFVVRDQVVHALVKSPVPLQLSLGLLRLDLCSATTCFRGQQCSNVAYTGGVVQPVCESFPQHGTPSTRESSRPHKSPFLAPLQNALARQRPPKDQAVSVQNLVRVARSMKYDQEVRRYGLKKQPVFLLILCSEFSGVLTRQVVILLTVNFGYIDFLANWVR